MSTLREQEQQKEKLRRELGDRVQAWLADPQVIDIMVNPDGRVWLDTLDQGMSATALVLDPTRIDLIIGTVAAYHGHVCNEESPRLRAVLPLGGQRFQGGRPPICSPMFVIRKHVPRVFTMAELIEQGTVTVEQAELLFRTLSERKNIVIAGETLSGKTVLLDTLLFEMPVLFGKNVRIVTIEDTRELRVAVDNAVSLEASDNVTMRMLLADAMRLNPSVIVVGEVRGAEAIEMIKSWLSGHGGSAATLHAGSAISAMHRLEAMVEESGAPANPRRIAEAVNLIVNMERRASNKWGIRKMVRCSEWKNGEYIFEEVEDAKVCRAQRGGDA